MLEEGREIVLGPGIVFGWWRGRERGREGERMAGMACSAIWQMPL